jgi:hypothetical protein
MDELDEQHYGIKPARPSLQAEKRGITRYLRTYEYVVNRDFPEYADAVHAECEALRQRIADVYSGKLSKQEPIEQVKRQDVLDNVIYQEWEAQRYTPNGIDSFATYSVFSCAKAVIKLMTEYRQDIATIFDDDIKREDALAFTQRQDYDESDPVWYLSNVFTAVPGTFAAHQVIQRKYGDKVRSVRELYKQEADDILPDSPVDTGYVYGQTHLGEDMAVELAVQYYMDGEGSADQVASMFGIPQKRFRKILKDLGVAQHRGGDRKG